MMTASDEVASAAVESPLAEGDVRRLASGAVLNLAGAAVSSVVNIALVVTITRGVPKAEAGVFFAATSLFLILAMVAKLGANTGLVYFVPRLRVLGRPDLIGRRLRNALMAVLAAAVLLGALLWTFADTAGDLVTRAHGEQATAYLRILAVLLPAAVLADVALAGTRGFRHMRPTVLLDLAARPILQLASTVLVVALDAPLAWLAVAWAAPYLPEMLAALVWLSRVPERRATTATTANVDGLGTSDFWRFTAPRALNAVVQLALQRLDIILIAVLRGPREAAIYTAATRFLVVGQLISQSISTVVQPRLAELLALRDQHGARMVYQVATCWGVLVSWPLYLLAVVFSTQLLAIFGRGYAAGAGVILLLAASMLVATLCGMVNVVLNMAGRTTWTLADGLLALAVMVGIDLVLIPQHGIFGAAVGWAAAILANNLIPLGQVATSLRLHPFGPGSWRAALLAGVCFGAVPLAVRAVAGSSPRDIVVAVVGGALLFAVGCHRLQRQLALDTLRGLWRRRARGPALVGGPA